MQELWAVQHAATVNGVAAAAEVTAIPVRIATAATTRLRIWAPGR